MKYLCQSGRHKHRTEHQADHCKTCRRSKDAKVRAYFRAQSEKMLKPVEVTWLL